jgi:hypothetical protein
MPLRSVEKCVISLRNALPAYQLRAILFVPTARPKRLLALRRDRHLLDTRRPRCASHSPLEAPRFGLKTLSWRHNPVGTSPHRNARPATWIAILPYWNKCQNMPQDTQAKYMKQAAACCDVIDKCT